jgi:RNA polymerase sigma factor (sigma-70 family)
MTNPNSDFAENSSDGGTLARPPITDWVRKFDDESVRELMTHYRPLLYEIARRRWRRQFQRRMDPSDALQLTWTSIAMSRRKNRFENRDHFMGFLMKTLSHHLVNIHRSLYAQKRSVAREVEPSEASNQPILDVQADDPTALDQLIEQELVVDTLQAMLRLPRELQRLLRWRFRKGMTYGEIAEKIDRTEDDVRRLVEKCVRALCLDLQINSRILR